MGREELAGMGFTIAVFPLTGLFASARALTDVYGHLRRNGATKDILDRLLTFHDFHDIVELERYHALDKRYSEE